MMGKSLIWKVLGAIGLYLWQRRGKKNKTTSRDRFN